MVRSVVSWDLKVEFWSDVERAQKVLFEADIPKKITKRDFLALMLKKYNKQEVEDIVKNLQLSEDPIKESLEYKAILKGMERTEHKISKETK